MVDTVRAKVLYQQALLALESFYFQNLGPNLGHNSDTEGDSVHVRVP